MERKTFMKSCDNIKSRLENIPSLQTVENLLHISKAIYIIGVIGAFLCIAIGIFLYKNNYDAIYCILIGGASAIAVLLLCRAASVLFDGFAVLVGSSWLTAQYVIAQTEYFFENLHIGEEN